MNNHDFCKSLRVTSHHYLLCDLHVHSIASADILHQGRFSALSEDEQRLISENVDGYDGYIDKHWELDTRISEAVSVEGYFSLIEHRRDKIAVSHDLSQGGKDWAIIAVTDHNTCRFSCKLSEYSWQNRSERRIVILPGMELEVEFRVAAEIQPAKVHICLIYPPATSENHIYASINEAIRAQQPNATWRFGETLVAERLDELVRSLRNSPTLPAACVAAHVSGSKGVRDATLRVLSAAQADFVRCSAEYEEIKNKVPHLEKSLPCQQAEKTLNALRDIIGSDDINLDVLRLIGRCGFDALQVAGVNDDVHYRCLHRFRKGFGRAVTILCSDAHRVDSIFECGLGFTPYIKFPCFDSSVSPQGFFKALKEYALRFGETRFTSVPSSGVGCYIKGIEISADAEEAKRFWPFDNSGKFTIPFSPNLNCLIGGRGSGKSAMIESLGFVLSPHDFDRQAERREAYEKKPDWYKRAYRTLAGCNVRVCWTSAEDRYQHLGKKSAFLSRYFDPNQKFETVNCTDVDGKRIVDNEIQSGCRIELYRMSDLENLANDEDQMRRLFDAICGDEIEQLQANISEVRDQLRDQRDDLKKVMVELGALTRDQSPLRTYAIRKRQYDAVNTEEVRRRYDRLDAASGAKRIVDGIVKSWKDVSKKADVATIGRSISQFCDDVDNKTKDKDGNVLGHMGGLRDALFKKDPRTQQRSVKDGLLLSTRSLEESIAQVSQLLKDHEASIAGLERTEEDSLAKDGLPGGAREREAKKRALNEAERDLELYEQKINTLSQQMAARGQKFSRLKELAQKRTGLRVRTAQYITNELKKNLNPSALIVEADARPIADRKQFDEWLTHNFFPPQTQAREARIQRLHEVQLMPETLKRILWGDADASGITNTLSRVRDGGINQEDAKHFTEFARVRFRAACESDEDSGPQAEIGDLPDTIRAGIWVFDQSEEKIDAFLKLDEIVLDDIPEIRLKDRPDEMQTARIITELSPGQRCSAVLPILLLNGKSPLVIDQPEDNLDNRLIREVIVDILCGMKLRRQVIIATHNPNLPVLADVEQAVVLQAVEQDKCRVETEGDIENAKVVRSITEIMEGGREAFQYRQSIYETHWEGPVYEEP